MVRVLTPRAGPRGAGAPGAGEGAGRGPEPAPRRPGARPARRSASPVFQPALARLLALRREQADAYGHGGERYDALLEGYEPGMRVARLTPGADARCATRSSPWWRRWARRRGRCRTLFRGAALRCRGRSGASRLRLLGGMGFDLEAGRQDPSIHPFTGGTHPHGRAAHHAHGRGEPARPPSSARIHEGGPRPVRAGLRRGALPHAAGGRALHGPARVPVPPLGERGGPQPRLLGALLPARCARPSRRRSPGWTWTRFHAAREPREPVAHPRRGGRGDVQPAHRAALRAGAAAHPRRAAAGGAARGVERAHAALPGRRRRRTTRRACCRTSTGPGASSATSPRTRWATSTRRRSTAPRSGPCRTDGALRRGELLPLRDWLRTHVHQPRATACRPRTSSAR